MRRAWLRSASANGSTRRRLQTFHCHRKGVQRGRPDDPFGGGECHHRIEHDALCARLRVVEGKSLTGFGVPHRGAGLGVCGSRRAGHDPLRHLGGTQLRADELAVCLALRAKIPDVSAFCVQDRRGARGDDRRSAAYCDDSVGLPFGDEIPRLLHGRQGTVLDDAVELSDELDPYGVVKSGHCRRMLEKRGHTDDHHPLHVHTRQLTGQRVESALAAEGPEGGRHVAQIQFFLHERLPPYDSTLAGALEARRVLACSHIRLRLRRVRFTCS